VNPGATVVFGGPESTCHPARSFECGADYVLKGEAEHTLPEFLDVITGRRAGRLEEIPGLMWRSDGRVVEGVPMRQLTAAELDALPPVDRALIHSAAGASVASVWRTRGCPGECDFCEVRELYPRCVRRSDERTLEELMAAQSDGYSTTFLIDDNAAANKPAFVEFLESIAERGYARMLVIQMRADAAFRSDGRLDREFLRLLKRAAAVTVVCVGVESATDANLESVQKHADASRTARALKAMRRRGLLVHGMFIALKHDTRAAIVRNGTYARRYVTSLQYLFETPLPGTKRTREHEAEGSMLFTSIRDLNLYDGMHVVLQPLKMPAEEMQVLVVREYRKFYSAARIAAAALRGAFLRFRLLDRGQRAYLRQVRGIRRLKLWARLHFEYKFAPVAFIATGRSRVKKMLKDAEYAAYLERVRQLSAAWSDEREGACT
jgi:anaerobic magnesium-protoporphyrin IX monomethyl ester cyclase